MQSVGVPPSVPCRLEPGRCLLFVYGLLQPGQLPPKTVTQAWADTVRGELYDLVKFPAAIHVGQGSRSFRGFVLEIAETELRDDLDRFEELDKGLYRRVRTMTASGHEVWIYEYARPILQGATGPIESWPRDSTI